MSDCNENLSINSPDLLEIYLSWKDAYTTLKDFIDHAHEENQSKSFDEFISPIVNKISFAVKSNNSSVVKEVLRASSKIDNGSQILIVLAAGFYMLDKGVISDRENTVECTKTNDE